jgi:hypothetical protein
MKTTVTTKEYSSIAGEDLSIKLTQLSLLSTLSCHSHNSVTPMVHEITLMVHEIPVLVKIVGETVYSSYSS